jgi:hypothetical protein
VLVAAIVAAVGVTIQFAFYNAAGIILALILCAPIVPLIDRFFPAGLYQWPTQLSLSFSNRNGVSHEILDPAE